MNVPILQNMRRVVGDYRAFSASDFRVLNNQPAQDEPNFIYHTLRGFANQILRYTGMAEVETAENAVAREAYIEALKDMEQIAHRCYGPADVLDDVAKHIVDPLEGDSGYTDNPHGDNERGFSRRMLQALEDNKDFSDMVLPVVLSRLQDNFVITADLKNMSNDMIAVMDPIERFSFGFEIARLSGNRSNGPMCRFGEEHVIGAYQEMKESEPKVARDLIDTTLMACDYQFGYAAGRTKGERWRRFFRAFPPFRPMFSGEMPCYDAEPLDLLRALRIDLIGDDKRALAKLSPVPLSRPADLKIG